MLRVLIVSALGLTLAAYALSVGHDFYTYADRAVTVTVDDGEASIAYALATQDRYAFLSSPLVSDFPRLHGQFNYGPWYFYLGAAVIWIFGYSLTAIRSIHFWVVIASAAVAVLWFRGRDRAAAPAIFAFGFLYFFGTVEWPMARPDSLVTAFAIALIVAAGRAISTANPAWWFAAGLAAACGAFTHLIAAALVPAAMLLLGAAVVMWRAESADAWRARALGSSIALAAGLFAGAAMFYASFGFDLPLQYRFLQSYRTVTASSDTYFQAIARHFAAAFGTFTPSGRALVVGILAGSSLLTIVLLARARFRTMAATYLLPPVVIWLLYIASNGKYTNYHSGYGILHHAMFLWTAASVAWSAFALTPKKLLSGVGVIASALVLMLGVRLTAAQVQRPPRARAAVAAVAFSDYQDHVLDLVPSRATAWGSVLFGIEAPDRVQMVQYGDAASLAKRMNPGARRSVAPDYVVWGPPDSTIEPPYANPPSADLLADTYEMFPSSSFALVSMTAAAPYGTTRVYQRTAHPSADARLPAVAVYDAAHQRWLDRLGEPKPLALSRVSPVPLRMGMEQREHTFTPRATSIASLPYGAYLLRVTLSPATSNGVLVVMTPATAREPVAGTVPGGDLLPYVGGSRQVDGLLFHEGGPLYLSQFDSGDTAIASVDAFPVGDLFLDNEQPSRSRPLPEFSKWEVAGYARASLRDGRFHVEGDNSALGYQVSTPVIPFLEGDYVEVQVPSVVSSGRICVGALNAAGYWLVSAMRWREVLNFRGDTSGGFKIMFANCNDGPNPAASRFDVGPGTFVDDTVDLYADRLTQRGLGLEKPLAVVSRESDLGYRAANVTRAANAWKISGKGESKYSFLLRSAARRLTPNDRVLISGTVSRGGLTVGLLRKDQWVGSGGNIDTAGAFRRVLVPPAADTYEIAVANFLGGDLSTDIVIDRIEVYQAGSVPE